MENDEGTVWKSGIYSVPVVEGREGNTWNKLWYWEWPVEGSCRRGCGNRITGSKSKVKKTGDTKHC
jgi:hypothetical protein